MAKKSKKSKKIELQQEEQQNLEIQNEETVNEEAMDIEAADDLSADLGGDIEISANLFQSEEAESEGFLPEASDEEENETDEMMAQGADVDLEGSELDGFESAQIDEVEFVEDEQAQSIVESILFASDRPVSLASIREVFKGTNVRKDKIKRILDNLAV